MNILLRMLLALGIGYLTLFAAQAQAVTNGDFETWAPRSGVSSPTGWLTTDDVLLAVAGRPLPSGSFTKTTDAHGGTYALRLETKNTLIGALPGAVVIGTKLGPDRTIPGGTPFTSRPTALQFYYKLSGPQPAVATNGASVEVKLTRTVDGKTQSVATAQQFLTAVTATYLLVQVPLTYVSSATPDSLHLVFSSGGNVATLGTVLTVGTVLQVDDVAFTGTVTASRSPNLTAMLNVFPNPSPDGHYVLMAAPALLAAPLTVVDATGRVAWQEGSRAQLAPTRTLDLSGLARGLYFLHVLTESEVVTSKLLVP